MASIQPKKVGMDSKNFTTYYEKEMMKDPTKVTSRVFVGSLPSEHMTKQNLKELFEQYGPVAGVIINNGFGFVQFEDEISATKALNAKQKLVYSGKKLDVKPARPMTQPKPPMGFSEERDRSPIRGDQFVDRGRDATRFPLVDHRRGFLNAPAKIPPPSPAADRGNDCEIIVIDKGQTEYAEYIEHRLRRIGLTVDLLFPNDDVPVTRVITNIANRGCIFAIVVLALNEEHRSITLNMLHGPPQEHRNMPLEDAVQLIQRSFEAHVLREKTARPSEIAVVGAGSMVGLSERHPENIQVLLNLLADSRNLTVLQFDKVISYLQGRREIQLKIELGDPAGSSALSPHIAPAIGAEKHNVLQSRIMNILNRGGSSPNMAAPAPVQAPKTPMLNDPNVQKALTNLMQGDLFRKIPDNR